MRQPLFVFLVLMVHAGTSNVAAQSLLKLVSERQPTISGGSPSVASSSVAAVQHPVEADLDLVRSGPARLELPTPSGRTLEALQTVFEDRGGGDVMWAGRFPDADHDSVLVTIADGRMAALFSEPLGSQYQIGTGASGMGRMTDMVAAGPEHGHGCAVGALDDGEESYSNVEASQSLAAQVVTDDELTIMIVYTSWVVEYWHDPYQTPGGVGMAYLQHSADYLTMVFRNGRLGVTPKFVFVEAPTWLNMVPVEGVSRQNSDILGAFAGSGEIELLRRQHGADMAHLFHTEYVVSQPWVKYGGLAWGSVQAWSGGGGPRNFAHETGHLLGGEHQPLVSARGHEEVDRLYDEGRAEAWQLYSFAHAWYEDGTTAPDGKRGDYGTAVAYPSTEPYYSTTRITPGGQEMGIVGRRENERAFRETVLVRAGLSIADDAVPLPPSELKAEVTGADSVRISWKDNSDDETGFKVRIWNVRRWPGAEVVVGPNVESVSLDGLPPAIHRYFVEPLMGVERAERQHWPYSSGREFLIPGAEPDPLEGFSLERGRTAYYNDCHQAVVRWTDPQIPRGEPGRQRGSLVEVRFYEDGELYFRYFVDPALETFSPPRCLHPDKEYAVRVYMQTWGGRSSALTASIPVLELDVEAHITGPTTATTGSPVTFDGSGSLEAERYIWKFGDGQGGDRTRDPQVTHTYMEPGAYQVKLTVIAGCHGGSWCKYEDTAEMTIVVEPGELPAPNFEIDTECRDGLCFARSGEPVTFHDHSTGTYYHMRYIMGDGQYEVNRGLDSPWSFSHTYSKPGFYRVTAELYGLGKRITTALDLHVAPGRPSGTCDEYDPVKMCLQNGRYEVQAEWLTASGERGPARIAHLGTKDSGIFWFFNPDNLEMLVKVLNGCTTNGHVWVFGASTTNLGYRVTVTDTRTGILREYTHEPGNPAPAIADPFAFPDGCSTTRTSTGQQPTPPPLTVQEPHRHELGRQACNYRPGFCLHDGRFKVSVKWSSPEKIGSGLEVPWTRTRDAGLFIFFHRDNWEMLVKVLDGCAVNGHYWVFGAAATDVEIELSVFDWTTKTQKFWRTPGGEPAPAIVDTAAFRCQQ